MNGLQNRSISYSFLNPEFITNLTVEQEHQNQWKEEEDDQNESSVYLLVNRACPFFQAANILFFIEKVIFILKQEGTIEKRTSSKSTLIYQTPIDLYGLL